MLPYILSSINRYASTLFSLVFGSTTAYRFLLRVVRSSVPMPTQNDTAFKLPDNIKALNTIIKVLSLIPRKVAIRPIDNLQSGAWETKEARQELKLLDAFAQLMVSSYEVVAVAASRSDLDMKVVSCFEERLKADIGEGEDDTTQAGRETRIRRIFNACRRSFQTFYIAVTPNPRPDNESTCSSERGPVYFRPKGPPNIHVVRYLENLDAQW